MDLGLHGKRAIVTGARRGLGFAIAQVLAEEGCNLAICARSDVAGAVSALSTYGTVVSGAVVDIADADAYRAWLAEAVETLGGCDVFVHNVSASSGSGEAAWTANLELDVLALVRALDVVVPAMEAAGSGSIVCMSSIAAQEIFDGPSSYGPMKAAMTAYAAHLAQELAPKAIRVNVVSPGPVLLEGGRWDRQSAFYEAAVSRMPRHRLGEPGEVANAVAFLASPAASLVAGANLVVDGGYTRRINF